MTTLRTASVLALLVVPWSALAIGVLWICRRWGVRVVIVKQEVKAVRKVA